MTVTIVIFTDSFFLLCFVFTNHVANDSLSHEFVCMHVLVGTEKLTLTFPLDLTHPTTNLSSNLPYTYIRLFSSFGGIMHAVKGLQHFEC